MSVAFVDTETTGLDPELDYVWEIAVIIDDDEHVWQQKLPELDGGPDWSYVSEWVRENTGIVERYDHGHALSPANSIDRLAVLVRGRHIVGACPWFDSERMHRVALEHSASRDLPWHYHLIDVEALAVGFLAARGLVPELPWDSRELSRLVGVDSEDFLPVHHALTDARWAKAIYDRITSGH